MLLINGADTSPNDVEAIEAILEDSQLGSSTVNFRQLDNLTEEQLLDSQLLIISGGNYIAIGSALLPLHHSVD